MNDEQSRYVCCFFGHRKINETKELWNTLLEIIEDLIVDKKVNTFLFGSKSEFNSLCLKVVTKLKEQFPYINRVYVRAEFPDISDSYRRYLLGFYDETYFPERVRGAGKVSYIKRNQEMVERSRFCVVYCDKNYIVPKIRDNIGGYRTKSGTLIAYDYAVKKKRKVINVVNGA